MECKNCKTELIWSNDFSYEDYSMEGEGIVSLYFCPNEVCEVEDVKILTPLDDAPVDKNLRTPSGQ